MNVPLASRNKLEMKTKLMSADIPSAAISTSSAAAVVPPGEVTF